MKNKELIRDWNCKLELKIEATSALIDQVQQTAYTEISNELLIFLGRTRDLDAALLARYRQDVEEDDNFEELKARAEEFEKARGLSLKKFRDLIKLKEERDSILDHCGEKPESWLGCPEANAALSRLCLIRSEIKAIEGIPSAPANTPEGDESGSVGRVG